MSKPIAKVTFSVLIALALIVGIYTSVQGAFASAGTRSGQAHVDAGLNADLSHPRSSGPPSAALRFKLITIATLTCTMADATPSPGLTLTTNTSSNSVNAAGQSI